MPRSAPLPSLADVTPAQWAALSARRVFFGHQSVGGNITQGISEVLAVHPEIRLDIVEQRDPGAMRAPGFYHASIGRNYFPAEKAAEFAQIGAGLRAEASVGMVKFCFVDVENIGDTRPIFDEYQHRIQEVRAANPGLTIVHLTMPLWTDQGSFVYWKRWIRRYPNERARNLLRNRYNDLLRTAYAGREPLFDIAELESTRQDGSRFVFRYGGETVFALAPELTDDGGHLNEAGRRLIAEQLLIFLARLPQAPSRAAS